MRGAGAAWRVAAAAALCSLWVTAPAECERQPAATPQQQQLDALGEQLLGDGVNRYMALLDAAARAGGGPGGGAAAAGGGAEHLQHFGQHSDACARLLRAAARISHRMGRAPAAPEALDAMHPAEARRIHVGQQAMLFLALLRELQGRRPQARAAYVSAMSSPASTPVNSLANIAKENLRALNGRPRQPSAGGGEWARRAREERFLVFRFWAGLSNRRQELIGMIAAARLLNRTLVLPVYIHAERESGGEAGGRGGVGACIHVCTCMKICTCMHAYVCMYIHLCTYTICTCIHTYMYIYISLYISTSISISICMYVCMYVYIYIYIYVCMYVW